MRRTIATLFGIVIAACAMPVQAEVTVMAVRLGANDVVKLAKFYEKAFGLKEIDRVGNPATEIIMRYGATVAEAKAGASPEFLGTETRGHGGQGSHAPCDLSRLRHQGLGGRGEGRAARRSSAMR